MTRDEAIERIRTITHSSDTEGHVIVDVLVALEVLKLSPPKLSVEEMLAAAVLATWQSGVITAARLNDELATRGLFIARVPDKSW